VGPSGEAAIVYSARLRWGVLNLGYSAVIHANSSGQTTQVQAWRGSPPGIQGATLQWDCRQLDAQGTWENLAPCPELELHEGIRWRCLQPGGHAHLRLGPGRELKGLGYAEELVLERPPWRLPFGELRWGRFVPDGDGAPLAWIQWRKGLERAWCLRGGRERILEECTGDGVRYSGGRIEFQAAGKLREGFLLREILGPGAALFPGSLRRFHESKELARGTRVEDSGIREGWVVHERVRLR
jgi:hypothetical protein